MNDPSRGPSRRGFMLGAGGGLVGGGLLGYAATRLGRYQTLPAEEPQAPKPPRTNAALPFQRVRFTGRSVEVAKPAFAMPGPFPGRVAEVLHRQSIDRGVIKPAVVTEMVHRGMMELTGAPDATAAWRRLFEPGDRVGIKVNPVGQSKKEGVVGAISNLAVILAIVDGLKLAGLGPKDVLLCERYANEFRQAGYDSFLEREMPEVEWYAGSTNYAGGQTDLEGRDADEQGRRMDPDPHVLGYDPDHFRRFEFLAPEHDPKDPLSYESHVSRVVTDKVNKIINVPVLKDHRSAGVTLALKNLSHGLANNVARTHPKPDFGPNRCGEFIPHVVALPVLRQRVVLHVLDGLIGVYEGGPGSWNDSWGTWEYKSLFFATDPVAMDHVGWQILDEERAKRGWAPVGRMGLNGNNRSHGEQFAIRQPEHVVLAGFLGLGEFDPQRIEYRQVEMG